MVIVGEKLASTSKRYILQLEQIPSATRADIFDIFRERRNGDRWRKVSQHVEKKAVIVVEMGLQHR